MNNKISLTDLTDQLAVSAKITKKEAGMFLKLLFELIEENLINDKIVKIKSLGTFKLVWVESRRIANVNTGEIQEIPGHYKTTFTPDSELSDAVNEPFAHLETVVLDDEIIADEPIIPNEFTPTITTENQPTIQENSVIVSEPESVMQNSTEIQAKPTTLKNSESEPKCHAELFLMENSNKEKEIRSFNVKPKPILTAMREENEKSLPENENEEYEEDEDPEGFKIVKRWIISLLIIILLAFTAYVLYNNFKTSNKLDFTQKIPSYEELAIQDSLEQRATQQASDTTPKASMDVNQETKQNVAKATPAQTVTKATSDLTKKTSENPVPTQAPVTKVSVTENKAPLKNEVAKTTPKATEKETAKSSKDEPKTYKSRKVIATEVMRPGSRLTLLAQKYYGNKAFWVYIYQANKSKIANPNNVPVGTELVIPAKESYSIDPNNKESIDQAKKLASSLLK